MASIDIESMDADLAVFDGRHDAVARQRRLFEYDHLPPHLQAVSRIFALTACAIVAVVDDCPELTNALHRLWEAKNLAVVAVARPEVSGGDTAG